MGKHTSEISTLKTATWLALATAAISGVSNFVNKYAVTAVKDPVAFTTLKNALVAVFLVGLILAMKKKTEIASLDRKQWAALVAIGVIGGSIPFALFFTGLTQTSAINASLIHKTLFVWVILLAAPLLKERMSPLQWLGVAAIFGANLLVGGFAGFKFNGGELMILAATLFWAVENIIAKKALDGISSTTVAAARMVIGSLVLLPIAAWRGGLAGLVGMQPSHWGWTVLATALLAGYVLTWYAALKRAPASYVAALLVPATLVTNALSAIFVTHSFAGRQLVSAALWIAGSALVIAFARRLPTTAVQPANA
jgi:drug/metabolite transporter (DMT)-like permease